MAWGRIEKYQCEHVLVADSQRKKKELIRIVRDKENNVFVDLTGKQNGRGAYICEDVHCLEKAMKTKALEKTLKVSVDSEIFEKLKEQLGDTNE